MNKQTGEHVDEKVARQVAEAAREQTWERPSFAKGLYMGDFDWDLIHPHPQARTRGRGARRPPSWHCCARP